ncbi:MAG: hypothetical protein LC808_16370 [Actinobacteria bacterium]|nr:hypothetical protein [Actinomycetota bacterium]
MGGVRCKAIPQRAAQRSFHLVRRPRPRPGRAATTPVPCRPSLLELGEDLEATERQLHRWKFHPVMSREAAAWAWDRHRRALAAAEGRDIDPDGGDGDEAA